MDEFESRGLLFSGAGVHAGGHRYSSAPHEDVWMQIYKACARERAQAVWIGRQTGLGVFISSRWGESWQCICVLEGRDGREGGGREEDCLVSPAAGAPLVSATTGATCTADEWVRPDERVSDR